MMGGVFGMERRGLTHFLIEAAKASGWKPSVS